jgi:hypothetical protein
MKIWEAPKDPDEVKDYKIDWTDGLNGANIVSSTWSIDVGDSRLVIDSSSHVSKITTVWLSGGRAGVNYDLLNRIVDDSVPAHTLDQTVRLYVRNK